MDQPVGQTAFTGHERGKKNSLSLFTYRLPEEMSGGNVVTNLASFPKYSKLSDFFRSVF